jgi:hypothetical protein
MTGTPERIGWLSQLEFYAHLQRSRTADKPLLLDFHDPDCPGCRELERSTYSNSEVVGAVSELILPVRVVVDRPDRLTEEIISRYIAISSPTIQIVSHRGTLQHGFQGAPRHTRLALSQWNRARSLPGDSCRRVYHESTGCLPPSRFLMQLAIGCGKAALQEGRVQEAARRFQEALSLPHADDAAIAEARYWSSAALSRVDGLPAGSAR